MVQDAAVEMIYFHPASPKHMATILQTGLIYEGEKQLAVFHDKDHQPAMGWQPYRIGIAQDSDGICTPEQLRALGKPIPPELDKANNWWGARIPIRLLSGQFVPQKFTNDGWKDLAPSDLDWLRTLAA
jgi:hypothetical protein